jgi:predicted nuclease of predicted toxin-antitoxin system
LKFLVDAQLPPALARFLQTEGHEAEHVVEAGLADADDGPIWDYAESHGAVVVTKDEDFATRKATRADGPAVVWLRVGNCSNRALLQWFKPLLRAVVDRLQQGEGLIEIV